MYDVFIGGLGVSGASVSYFVCEYLKGATTIAGVEHYEAPALVNSKSMHNAQTLHRGENETNYDLSHAIEMRDKAKILEAFLLAHATKGDGTYRRVSKMLLGVGDAEVALLRKRYEEFHPYFPYIKLLERDEIALYEPKAVEGRDPKEPILAFLVENGFAVNYQKLAELFIASARASAAARGKTYDTFFNTEITGISRDGKLWVITTTNGTFRARIAIFATGPYSLLFAHRLGYAKDLALLPVAGSFYRSKIPHLLNGKIYQPQKEGLPFARFHADTSVEGNGETRFGPTAKPLPLFERHHWGTFVDFLRIGTFSLRGLRALASIFASKTVLGFAFKNALYEMPYIGKRLVLKELQRIIPTIRARDIELCRGAGGIRPQIIDLAKRKLQMGIETIYGDDSMFIVTPSPGASSSGKTGETAARKAAEMLGDEHFFDEEAFRKEFGN